jgi:hypothetical protein
MTLEKTVLENFRELPQDKQQEVLNFIQFLRYKSSAKEPLAISEQQEVLTETQEINDFWTALQDFRQRVDLESLDDDSLENLRDKSPGREVNL